MGRRAVSLVVAIVIVAAAVVALVVALAAPSAIQAIDLVPQNANFVAGIQISKILTDEDIAEAYNEVEKPPEWPQTIDDALAWVDNEIGIDPSDFTDALIFGDIESEDSFGALVIGTFDPEALIDSIEGAVGEEMSISTYEGYQVYTVTIGDQAGAICFLSDDTIAVGLEDGVKDVIDVREGAPHLSGPVYDSYTSLGDVWLKGALRMPEDAMGAISEWEIPIGLDAFEGIQTVGFGLNKEGEDLSLQIKLHFSDTESAEAAEDMISGILDFLPLMMPDIPSEIADLLDGLSVSRSGSWLTISLETTVTGIEGLMEGDTSFFDI